MWMNSPVPEYGTQYNSMSAKPKSKKSGGRSKGSDRQLEIFSAKGPRPIDTGNQSARRAIEKLLKPEDLLDPAVRRWAEQLFHLFDRDANVAFPMPIFTNQFPCPSTVRKATSLELTSVTAGVMGMWMFAPNGVMATSTVAGDYPIQETWTSGPAQDVSCGPPFTFYNATTTLDEVSAYGIYAQWALDNSATVSTTLLNASVNKMLRWSTSWGNRANLGVSGEVSDSGFRCVGMQVRVTNAAKLTDISGWVECYLPYEPVGAVGTYANYREQGYRREYFGNGNRRSYTFTWIPTCDDLEFTHFASGSQRYGNTGTVTRMTIFVGGLAATSSIQVEVEAVYELNGRLFSATNIPRIVSHDSTHVVNAIAKGVANSNMAHDHHVVKEIAVRKVGEAHPFLRKALGTVEDIVSDVGAVYQTAQKFMPLISRVFSM